MCTQITSAAGLNNIRFACSRRECRVDKAPFDTGQPLLRQRNRPRSLKEKLEPLRRLLREHGHLSAKLIDRTPGVPGCGAYHRWFGGLYRAYELVGFVAARKQRKPHRAERSIVRRLSDEWLLESLRQLLISRGRLSEDVINETENIPCACTYKKRFGGLRRAYKLIGYTDRLTRRRRFGLLTRAFRMASDDELLGRLRDLLARQGYLSRGTIDACPEVPCASTYRYRFDSGRYREGDSPYSKLRRNLDCSG